MKFSFCSIAFRNQKIALQKLITYLAKVGYQGIELWANHIYPANTSFKNTNRLNGKINFKDLKRDLQKHNLKVPMLAPYFDFTAGLDEWQKSIRTAEHYIELSSFLQVPIIRAFTGTVGSLEATEMQKRECIQGLKKVCQIAENKQITIALETHPSTLVDNIESTLWLIKKVGASNLKINLDIYHMFEVHKNPVMVLEALFPHIAHVHAKNAIIAPEERSEAKHPLLHDPQPKANFVGVKPLALGEMDYKPFIQSLARKNYDGYVSVEWFGSNPMEAAASELAYLQNIEKEIAINELSRVG